MNKMILRWQLKRLITTNLKNRTNLRKGVNMNRLGWNHSNASINRSLVNEQPIMLNVKDSHNRRSSEDNNKPKDHYELQLKKNKRNRVRNYLYLIEKMFHQALSNLFKKIIWKQKIYVPKLVLGSKTWIQWWIIWAFKQFI